MVIFYINFVEFVSPILHAKFQHNRISGSGVEFSEVFTIYGVTAILVMT